MFTIILLLSFVVLCLIIPIVLSIIYQTRYDSELKATKRIQAIVVLCSTGSATSDDIEEGISLCKHYGLFPQTMTELQSYKERISKTC